MKVHIHRGDSLAPVTALTRGTIFFDKDGGLNIVTSENTVYRFHDDELRKRGLVPEAFVDQEGVTVLRPGETVTITLTA